VLETDAPFLPPVPKRGMRNEPAFLLYTATHLAGILDVSLDKVIEVTAGNAESVFGC